MQVILDGLNPEQRRAVGKTEGPVLIIAGAGSGKTRVLTSRVAYIIQGGVDPSRILALTFTKKAAGEMKERIALMVGSQKARKVVMGTFHSIFVRFLRDYASFLGYPSQFTIYDTSDSLSAIKACIKELGLDDKTYKPKDVLSRISNAKNNLVTVSAYRANTGLLAADMHGKKPRMIDLYDLYQAKMKQSGVMDFDDILVNMNILLRDNKEALTDISSRFSYIMVDEYQDTNFAQYLILRKLAAAHRNICVVGDDSQSIYAFRGAKIENILNFKKDYPECVIFRLELNYRSTSNIVGAANSVIVKNEGRIPKECYSESGAGEKLHLVSTFTEQEEALRIASDIADRIRTDHASYRDFAILYRTNSQSRAIEEVLRRRNIPYIIYSGNSFFERAEVKDMMAYFKLAVNPDDEESFKRVVNKPARGIGDTSLDALARIAHENRTTLFKAAFCDNAEELGLRFAAAEKIRAFCRMISALAAQVHNTDAHELAKKIADESGLYAFYKADTSIEGMSRTTNVEELIDSVEVFCEERYEEMEMNGDTGVVTLDDYLENAALLSNVDVTEDEESDNKVSLMTVHSAKGLEYPYVTIAGLEENLFPSMNMINSRADIEEERRLFYVAVTRAKKAVTLTYAHTRMRNGKHESNDLSRFVREIDPKYLDNPPREESFEEPEGTRPIFGSRGFGGFGSPTRGPISYGRSSAVRYEKPAAGRQQPSQRPGFQRPAPASPRPAPAAPVRPTAPPPVIDPHFIPEPMTAFKAGDRIEHNRFGAGRIVSMTGEVPEIKAVIDFDAYGEKTLLLKYAKMRHGN